MVLGMRAPTLVVRMHTLSNSNSNMTVSRDINNFPEYHNDRFDGPSGKSLRVSVLKCQNSLSIEFQKPHCFHEASEH